MCSGIGVLCTVVCVRSLVWFIAGLKAGRHRFNCVSGIACNLL